MKSKTLYWLFFSTILLCSENLYALSWGSITNFIDDVVKYSDEAYDYIKGFGKKTADEAPAPELQKPDPAVDEIQKETRRRITNLEKEFINSGNKKTVNGKKVVQRDQTFDKDYTDAEGRTNCDRMKRGLAPLGKDGKSVELHHLKQQDDGIITEMTFSEHKDYTNILHRYTDTSEINRKDFKVWRIQYWKERANSLCQ